MATATTGTISERTTGKRKATKRISKRGRREANAPCPHCGKRHGDNAPWWNAGKDGWSVTIKQTDPATGKAIARNRLVARGWEGHDAAIQQWLESQTNRADLFPATGESPTVKMICLWYLDEHLAKGKPKTYANVNKILQDFCNHPRHGLGNRTLAELEKGKGLDLVMAWIDAHTWDNSSKAINCQWVKAAFNFAANRGRIAANPLANLNKATTGGRKWKVGSRQETYSQKQIDTILANANPRGFAEDRFGMIFKMLLLTGCRPSELTTATAANVYTDADTNDLYLMVDHKNQRHTGNQRRIFLTPDAQQIIREQMAKYPTGPLFRSHWGLAWTNDTLENYLRRITDRPACAALGLNRKRTGKNSVGGNKATYDYTVYNLRHSFAHRWLTGFYKRDGKPIVLDSGQVAGLIGVTQAQVEKTYGHRTANRAFMQALIS